MGVGCWVLMNGGGYGEVCGEVSGKHLTIQTPHKQRDSGQFGEVLRVFP